MHVLFLVNIGWGMVDTPGAGVSRKSRQLIPGEMLRIVRTQCPIDETEDLAKTLGILHDQILADLVLAEQRRLVQPGIRVEPRLKNVARPPTPMTSGR